MADCSMTVVSFGQICIPINLSCCFPRKAGLVVIPLERLGEEGLVTKPAHQILGF